MTNYTYQNDTPQSQEHKIFISPSIYTELKQTLEDLRRFNKHMEYLYTGKQR